MKGSAPCPRLCSDDPVGPRTEMLRRAHNVRCDFCVLRDFVVGNRPVRADPLPDAYLLKVAEAGLHNGVVLTGAATAHAWHWPVGTSETTPFISAVLGSLVGDGCRVLRRLPRPAQPVTRQNHVSAKSWDVPVRTIPFDLQTLGIRVPRPPPSHAKRRRGLSPGRTISARPGRTRSPPP